MTWILQSPNNINASLGLCKYKCEIIIENNIGSRFKFVRQLNNLNPKQFAEKINISQGRLSEIEKGICNPSAETLISTAEQKLAVA
jgi:DNA-binding XRE family transcriptional regulator